MTDSTFDRGTATVNGVPSLQDRVRELRLDGKANAPTGRGSNPAAWLPWVLCILLAGAWASMGMRWYRAAPSTTPETAAVKGPALKSAPTPSIGGGDAGTQPKAEPDALVLEAKGYLIPSHSISISPIDVSGRIIDLRIEEGKYFKKGELLAAIDSTPFEAEKLEAEAQVAAANARYIESKSAWQLEIEGAKAETSEARSALAEAKLVYETARMPRGGAVASLEVGQAQRKLEAAQHRVDVLDLKRQLIEGESRKQHIEALQRDLQAAQARLKKATWRLDNCKITAPVEGIILSKRTEFGSLVNPVALNSGSTGGVATGIGDIADLSKLEVDLEIQERDIAKIKEGMVCRVRPDAYPDRTYDGFYDRAMPIGNRARGIIPVRVRVQLKAGEKQAEYLKPEMGVSVVFVNRQVDPKVREEFEKAEEEYRSGASDTTKSKKE